MDIRPLPIAGALEITPRQFPDDRGVFLESFRGDHLAEVVGHRLDVRADQRLGLRRAAPCAASTSPTCRVGQAKYVTAVSGSLIDFVVDLRVGSPTFGQWDSVLLDAVDRRAVYLSEGLGHAFCALEDGTTAHYLCSAAYNPERRARHQPARPRAWGSAARRHRAAPVAQGLRRADPRGCRGAGPAPVLCRVPRLPGEPGERPRRERSLTPLGRRHTPSVRAQGRSQQVQRSRRR